MRWEGFPQLFLGLVVLSVGFAIGGSAVGDGLRARSGQEMITVTGSARKTIVSDTGVIQITAPNATDTSGEGVYDTSTIEKDATAVVRLTFGLR